MRNKFYPISVQKQNIREYRALIKDLFPHLTILFAVCLYLYYNWWNSGSLWHAFFSVILSLVTAMIAFPVVLMQKIRIENGSMEVLYSLLPNQKFDHVSDALYKIVLDSEGRIISYFFREGKNKARISPKGYSNGMELEDFFVNIIRNDNIIFHPSLKNRRILRRSRDKY
ncbi:MAG: hypothetical protein D3911_03255 [Candidatus Electrothrix sp. AW3_4]|nr:hypothetical protein [Candidatus Electrothrix gigas]